jgi:calcineurin-like phosphoesterase family protein
MNYWIITDTHLGHEKMKSLCGRPENFSEKILIGLNRTVPCPDVLIHLGDICMKDDEFWHEQIAKWVHCKRWLIRGNHDKKSDVWYLEHGWHVVVESMILHRFGKYIALSHKPLPDFGYDINIHGHFHNNPRERWEPELKKIMTDKHRLLVLEDTDYLPVNLERIVK